MNGFAGTAKPFIHSPYAKYYKVFIEVPMRKVGLTADLTLETRAKIFRRKIFASFKSLVYSILLLEIFKNKKYRNFPILDNIWLSTTGLLAEPQELLRFS